MVRAAWFLAAVFLWPTSLVLAQKEVLTPAENLVVEGIPSIPTSLAAAVDQYTNFRSAFFSSWHPARREMLIATRFGDTYQAHQVKFPGGARTQLTFFPDNVRGGHYQPGTGTSFVFAMDRGGNEFYQLYRYDLAAGAITLLTDGKSRNTGPLWSAEGRQLAYGSTRRTGKDVDLYLIDPSDPKSGRLLARLEGGGWNALDWSPDGSKLLVGEYISVNESYLWLCDLATGEKTLLTLKGGTDKVAYSDAKFSKDGKGLYVSTDRGSQFRRLAYFDLATRQHTVLTAHIPWDVHEVELSDDGKSIAFVTNEAGTAVFHLLDAASGKEKPIPKLPGGQIAGLKWHKNGVDLGFSLTNARSPTDAYALNIETGKIERWTESETGGLDTHQFLEPELVEWKSFDGRRVTGFLYLPSRKFTGKHPVVIDIHGGPEGQFRPRFLGRDNYLLNELGVAMIFPNIRGSTGCGKEFANLDNGFLRENSYKDIGALLDWIATRPDLDADRIMVTGVSYGGHMTLAVATLYSDKIRCAVDVVGPSNLVTLLENTSGYRQDLRRVEYGDERDPKMREYLNRIAPLNNAEKIKKPLFVIQGQNDPRVPRSESEQMVAAVRKNGTPVWYLLAKDEGHGFAKKKNADFQFYATVLFMQEYLLK